jgi:Tol biopolymer transport system component
MLQSIRLAIASLVVFVFGSTVAAESPAILRLTSDGHLKQRPSWSPDGSTLAFTRHQGSTIFLFLRSADGKEERRLTKREAPEYDACWSPDGKRLAFAYDNAMPNQGDIEVYSIGADGEGLQAVATRPGKLTHEEWPLVARRQVDRLVQPARTTRTSTPAARRQT